jgi:hypothetical protein
MEESNEQIITFLEKQVKTNESFFNIAASKCVGFLGTSPESGTFTKLFPRKILNTRKSENSYYMEIVTEGSINYPLKKGETIAVSITDIKTFSGYQIKEGEFLKEKSKSGQDVIEVKYVYTIHHTPNTAIKFETIPYDDVIQLAKKNVICILGIGASPNISPRFVCHFSNDNGKLKLFYGNGFMNKTYANFIKNKKVSIFVPDLNTMTGFVFFGEGKNIIPESNPEASEKVKALFSAGGWGEPRHITELSVESWEAVKL